MLQGSYRFKVLETLCFFGKNNLYLDTDVTQIIIDLKVTYFAGHRISEEIAL